MTDAYFQHRVYSELTTHNSLQTDGQILNFYWDIVATFAQTAKFLRIPSHVLLCVHAFQWLVYLLNLNLRVVKNSILRFLSLDSN